MPEFDLTQFISTFDRIRDKAIEERRITENPPAEEMRTLVEKVSGVKKQGAFLNFGSFLDGIVIVIPQGQESSYLPQQVLRMKKQRGHSLNSAPS